jgi:glycosyltransferase involved in cell wall biosynthesis
VLIEAGLRGVPVVATDVGGVSEIVADGETGFLVGVGDVQAMAQSIRASLRRADEFGLAARLRCTERFDLEVITDQWEELLRSIADRSFGKGTT